MISKVSRRDYYSRKISNAVHTVFRTRNRKISSIVTGLVLVVFILSQIIAPASAVTAWTQSDWGGGVGESTSNQYKSASNIQTTDGAFSLSKVEKFTDGEIAENVDSWTPALPTGGNITTYVGNGNNGTLNQTYRVHSFTNIGSSVFSTPFALSVDLLVVAGGGASGYSSGGGGGGGGVIHQESYSIASGSLTSVSVGDGGAL